jgi:Concanavalin A-like lectin/glucanases superfamily/Immunoglobulin domain
MKTTKALFWILTVTAALMARAPAQSFFTNGLVAYFPFDGNANDASGNGNNGFAENTYSTTNQFGQTNSALGFEGNSWVYIPYSPSLFTSNFSVSLMFNSQTGFADFCLLRSGNVSSDPYLGYEISERDFDQFFGFSDFDGIYNANNFGHEYDSAECVTPIGNWQQDQWYNLTFTQCGTNAQLYINGVLISSAANTPPYAPAQSSPLYIGADAIDPATSDPTAAPWDFFTGIIYDVRFYNRALSSNEVAQLYAYESGTNPPSITGQPQPLIVNADANVSFAVAATGTPALIYQWSLNGTNISGATSSSLAISNVVQTNLGTYAVVVANEFGSVSSSNATLSMYPFIATPFSGAITYWGKDATLNVGAWGTGPLSYQWFDNGNAIAGATNQALDLTSIQVTNAGLYSVVVTSPLGSATNAPAQVVVEPAGVSLGFSPTLTISGVVGYSYIIQSTANLADTNAWVTLTNLTLTQPVQLWVDTNVDASSPFNPKFFYQVLPGQ